MRVVIPCPARDGDLFASDAFSDQIGKVTNMVIAGEVATGLLVDARVSRNGKMATLTYEITPMEDK